MRMSPRMLLALVLVFTSCATVAAPVSVDQDEIPDDSGIAVGRLGFVTKKKIAIKTFQLAAVQVPDGAKYWIHAKLDGEGEETGAFFVSLPPGIYRLTQWVATATDSEWAGEDTGLSMEIVPGQAVCIGALYLHPNERQMFRLEQAESPPPVVRDECEALGELLRQRARSLPRTAVKIAQPVSRKRS
jgi:hypothetical protein